MNRFVILMKKKTEDAEGNDDIEEAFRIFDSKNDGLASIVSVFKELGVIIISIPSILIFFFLYPVIMIMLQSDLRGGTDERYDLSWQSKNYGRNKGDDCHVCHDSDDQKNHDDDCHDDTFRR